MSVSNGSWFYSSNSHNSPSKFVLTDIATSRTASRGSLLSVPTNTYDRLESMRQAVKDELFLTDLNATMEDFEDPHNETAMAVAPAERDVYNNALF